MGLIRGETEVTTITGGELLANVPKEAGECVGMLDFKGRVFIACQFVVFEFFPSPTHAAKGRLLPVELDNLKDPPGTIILRNAMQAILAWKDDSESAALLKGIAREALEEAGYPLSTS
jgi:hypothetical protein